MKFILKLILALLCITACFLLYFKQQVANPLKNLSHQQSPKEQMENLVTNDKWIVVTKVSEQTEYIEEMAQLQDWRIVVVDEQNTPETWSCKNCVVLATDIQEIFGSEISSLDSRKMIGYLYAIQHGAKYIYDTDDNKGPSKSALEVFEYLNETSGLVSLTKSSGTIFNVYAHFGRPDIWPKGFPFEYFSENGKPQYVLCETTKTPIIQKGLLNQLDSAAPPLILPENVYCPFSSGNTLFHYDAFWALLLHPQVTVQGYWAQRLLHLTGNNLGFYPPNSQQHSTPHNYQEVFLNERSLNSDIETLVQMLQQWSCKFTSFADCIIDLSQFMVLNNFWKDKDVLLVKSWIKNLVHLGYKFPKINTLNNANLVKKCATANFVSTFHKKLTSSQHKINHLNKLINFCQPFLDQFLLVHDVAEEQLAHTKDVILIVVINVSDRKNCDHIPFLQLLYEPWFANVIFCSEFKYDFLEVAKFANEEYRQFWNEYDQFSFVNLTYDEMARGIYHYMCLNKVAQMKISNVKGYLVVADDMLINFWNVFDNNEIRYGDYDFPRNKTNGVSPRFLLFYFKMLNVIKSLNELAEISDTYSNMLENMKRFNQFPYLMCTCDTYYLPIRYMVDFKVLSSVFWSNRVVFTRAIPQVLALLGWTNFHGDTLPFSTNIAYSTIDDDFVHASGVLLKGKYNQNKTVRGGPKMFDFFDVNEFFLHPVKLSHMNEIKFKRNFCTVYVKSLINSVSQSFLKIYI